MKPAKPTTVLIVEDNPDIGYALVVMLQAADFHTVAANDGKTGLDMALTTHPDVILLDLTLPKMNGQTVLAKLREDEWGKQVPVIILTNEADTQTIADSLEHSAQGYFIKADTDLNTIVESIQDVLRKA